MPSLGFGSVTWVGVIGAGGLVAGGRARRPEEFMWSGVTYGFPRDFNMWREGQCGFALALECASARMTGFHFLNGVKFRDFAWLGLSCFGSRGSLLGRRASRASPCKRSRVEYGHFGFLRLRYGMTYACFFKGGCLGDFAWLGLLDAEKLLPHSGNGGGRRPG